MALEVDSLIDIDCFEFNPSGTKPPDTEYQETKLHCMFKIKHDLRRNSRLVAGWIEFKAVNIYKTVNFQSHGITPLGVLPLSINL